MAQAQYFAHADFNCPFCVALSERLRGLGAEAEVEWRPIQHLRDAPEPARPLQDGDLAELGEELDRLGTLEPEIAIRNTVLRPSSRLATWALMSIRATDPKLPWQFIHGIYRALWREGRDISDIAVVREVAEDCGIELPEVFAGTKELEPSIATSQSERENGDFDRRLPVVQSPHGATLMGLGSPPVPRVGSLFDPIRRRSLRRPERSRLSLA